MTERDIRVRAITISLATLTTLALVAGIAGPTAAAPARPDRPSAPTQEECEEDDSGTHVGVGCGNEDDGGSGDDNDDGGSNGGIDPVAVCEDTYPDWGDCVGFVEMNGIHPDDMCGYMIDPNQEFLDYYQPDAPEGALLTTWICPREGTFYTEDTAWVMGNVPIPPSPEEVAEDIWAEVQATLLNPTLETWPPRDMSSVLDLPSFVAVTNWQGVQRDGDCDTGVCVDIEATPALSFDPGDGSAAVACEPGGTRFDRNGAEPEVQAGGDACAHVYTRRTGVGDRPEAWPGVVSITWTVTWQERGGAGESGEIGPVVLSAALPRVVTELSSVVTDVAPQGGG